MSELLVSGASTPQPDGTILTVTPESAGWERVGFEVLVLSPGGTAERVCGPRELCIVVISGVVTTIFLGGWMMPFGIHPPGWVDPFVVLGKMCFFIFLFIWIRATLPRLRYDQLMAFGWKILLPLATVNALVTAILVVVTH